ncbi:hypothetical protein DL768_005897 [Monosporascus sp. mg162]|nr:hypothetical protein DL768_005897 [Monosporascus sp. mg162]
MCDGVYNWSNSERNPPRYGSEESYGRRTAPLFPGYRPRGHQPQADQPQNSTESRNNSTSRTLVAAENEHRTVEGLLVERSVDINGEDYDRWTASQLAAMEDWGDAAVAIGDAMEDWGDAAVAIGERRKCQR